MQLAAVPLLLPKCKTNKLHKELVFVAVEEGELWLVLTQLLLIRQLQVGAGVQMVKLV